MIPSKAANSATCLFLLYDKFFDKTSLILCSFKSFAILIFSLFLLLFIFKLLSEIFLLDFDL